MTQKREVTVLLGALVVTTGLLGAGVWWLTQKTGVDVNRWLTSASPSATSAPEVRASFAQVSGVPTGLFNYGGSTTWAPIRRDVDPTLQTVWPEFRLRYTNPVTGTPGSSSGIRMLLDNQLAFAQSSRSLRDREYQQAQQRGFTLKEIPVAIDGIAVVVHPELTLPGLTLEQLRQIYTGRVTNWRQVGGPDLPITPYSRRLDDGGTIEFFVEQVLGNQPLGAAVELIATTTQALRLVAARPGSIYYASAPEAVSQCTVRPLPIGRQAGEWVAPYREPFVPLEKCPNQRNQLNTIAFQQGQYPITRRLFVVVKQNGQTDQQAGEAYAQLLLTNQGQELIAKAGFVSVR